MKNISYLLGGLLLSLLLALTCYDGFFVVISILYQLKTFLWVGLGIVLMLVVNRLFFSRLNFLKIHTHEMAHIIVSWLFFRRVTSLEVRENDGMMYHTTGRFGDSFIVLAPYCLPYYTYFFLFIRCFLTPSSVWIFDIIIGVTLAFHGLCFKEQTYADQPDIKRSPLWFSFLFIGTFRLFNLLLILLSIYKNHGVSLNLSGAIDYVTINFWSTLQKIF